MDSGRSRSRPRSLPRQAPARRRRGRAQGAGDAISKRLVTLRSLLRLGAIGLAGIAVWLVSVLFFVLPHRNDAQIPFWTVVMLGFLAYAVATWLYLRQPRSWLWVVMLFGSVGAILLGSSAIVAQEIRFARGGDWEGYILLMGLALSLHGLVALIHLWRSRGAWRTLRS